MKGYRLGRIKFAPRRPQPLVPQPPVPQPPAPQPPAPQPPAPHPQVPHQPVAQPPVPHQPVPYIHQAAHYGSGAGEFAQGSTQPKPDSDSDPDSDPDEEDSYSDFSDSSFTPEEDDDLNRAFREKELEPKFAGQKSKPASTEFRKWRKNNNPTVQTFVYLIEKSIESTDQEHLVRAIIYLRELASFTSTDREVLTQLLIKARDKALSLPYLTPFERIQKIAKRKEIKLP